MFNSRLLISLTIGFTICTKICFANISLDCNLDNIKDRELVAISCTGDDGSSYYGEGSFRSPHPKEVHYNIEAQSGANLNSCQAFEIVPTPDMMSSQITFKDKNSNEVTASGSGDWGFTYNEFIGQGSWNNSPCV